MLKIHMKFHCANSSIAHAQPHTSMNICGWTFDCSQRRIFVRSSVGDGGNARWLWKLLLLLLFVCKMLEPSLILATNNALYLLLHCACATLLNYKFNAPNTNSSTKTETETNTKTRYTWTYTYVTRFSCITAMEKMIRSRHWWRWRWLRRCCW